MVEEITLHNKTLNTYITLNRTNSDYYLDDNSPDWGTVQATQFTYPILSTGIGLGLTKITAHQQRIINIVGWVINDKNSSIEKKKQALNTFCNLFDEIEIFAGEYKITGYFYNSVIYPAEDKNNNDCKCKFMLTISCLQPMFEKGEITSGESTSELIPAWYFPWVIPENNFIFGSQQKYNYAMINNIGAVSTGFVMELTTSSNITGLSFSLGNQHFKLKSTYTLEPATKIIVSTVSGSQGIWKEISGTRTSAFDILDLTSDFIQLPVGKSKLEIDCEEGSISTLTVSISFKPLYYSMEDA